MALGQGAYSEKSIRDAQNQFLSNLAFAIKPSAARAAGFQNTELLKAVYAERTRGVVLIEHADGDEILIAPHVEYSRIPSLLAQATTETEPLSAEKVEENQLVDDRK